MGRIPIREIVKAAQTGRRSPLFIYLMNHFQEISQALAHVGRPNWDELAKRFGEAGLTDLSGKPPTRDNTRNTWLKVRKAAAQSGLAATPQPLTSRRIRTAQAGPPVTVLQHTPDREPGQPRPRPKIVLKSAVALKEGEPAQQDGSQLPSPLRPTTKDS